MVVRFFVLESFYRDGGSVTTPSSVLQRLDPDFPESISRRGNRGKMMKQREIVRMVKKIMKSHPAKWMIWEGNPIKTSSDGLKSLGIASLVFDPCGNEPEKGDFLTVMRQNMENLKGAFL